MELMEMSCRRPGEAIARSAAGKLRRRIAAREQCRNEARKAREHAPIGIAELAHDPEHAEWGAARIIETPG
jgi:hypothetical protein